MPRVLIQGVDGTTPYDVAVDADGHLQVDALAVAPTDVVLGAVTNLALAAGAVYLESAAVPTGKQWKLTRISWNYTGTVPAIVRLAAYDGSATYAIADVASPTSGLYYGHTGEIWLKAAWTIRLYFLNATLNDDGYLRLFGIALAA